MTDDPSAKAAHVGEQVKTEDLDVNFFKPLSGHARANMRLIVTLFLIWAVAVFGFQFLLLALEKPTPEPNYETFQSVWSKVAQDSANAEEQRAFAKVALAVLGKNVAVSAQHREVLRESLTATVLSLLPVDQRSTFSSHLASGSTDEAVNEAINALGLKNEGFERLMIALLPSSLVDVDTPKITQGNKEAIPEIMSLYLIHNQSILTDFRLVGFPFHYWYTAQFLLILFVLLCLVYAVQIDKIHSKYGFVEE